jgi:predicted cupin superfamily sugar epimerase
MQRAVSGDLSASEIIALLQMKPHPEGGHYVETFRDAEGPEGRGFSTSIYFLLQAGEVSAWHRVDGGEHWFGMQAGRWR